MEMRFKEIYLNYEWQKIISKFFLGHLSFNFSIIFFLAEIKIGLCLFIVAVSSAVLPGGIALAEGGNLLP